MILGLATFLICYKHKTPTYPQMQKTGYISKDTLAKKWLFVDQGCWSVAKKKDDEKKGQS